MSAIDYLQKLAAFPRYSGTESEKKAAEFIASEFINLGYVVSQEDTTYIGSDRYVYILSGLMLGLSVTFVALSRSVNSLALAALILLYLGFMIKVYPRCELKIARGKSINVIGTANPEQKRRIIVCAHYDSPRVRGKYLQKMAKPLRQLSPFFTMVQIAFVLTLLVHGGYALASTRRFQLGDGLGHSFWLCLWWFFLVFTVVRVGLRLFLVSQVLTTRYSLGADDNASGIAVLLETARLLPQETTRECRVDFACFAAEERGLFGSRKWVNEHVRDFEKERTYVLNLDCVGRGRSILLIRGVGTVFKRPSDTTLYGLVKRLCEELKYSCLEEWGSRSDHNEFLQKKLRCMAIMRGDTEKAGLGQRALDWLWRIPVKRERIGVFDWIHTEDDTAAKINPVYLDETVALTLRFIKEASGLEGRAVVS